MCVFHVKTSDDEWKERVEGFVFVFFPFERDYIHNVSFVCVCVCAVDGSIPVHCMRVCVWVFSSVQTISLESITVVCVFPCRAASRRRCQAAGSAPSWPSCIMLVLREANLLPLPLPPPLRVGFFRRHAEARSVHCIICLTVRF